MQSNSLLSLLLAAAVSAQATFKLQANTAFTYTPDPGLNGDYIQIGPISGSSDVMILTSNAAAASTFTLNGDGTLQSGDEFADIPAGNPGYVPLLFNTQATISAQNDTESVCSIAGGVLTCQTGQNDVFFTCSANGEPAGPGPYTVDVGPTGRPFEDYCYTLDLMAVSV